jgi:hypothetical protein
LEKQQFIKKLEAFIRKFYTNELIGNYFLYRFRIVVFSIYAFVEYFLWLKPMEEPFYFGLSLSRSLFVVSFYFVPIFKLFKLQKGIDYNQASAIIGNHFRK